MSLGMGVFEGLQDRVPPAAGTHVEAEPFTHDYKKREKGTVHYSLMRGS